MFFFSRAPFLCKVMITFFRCFGNMKELCRHIWSKMLKTENREKYVDLLSLVNRVYETRIETFCWSQRRAVLEAKVSTTSLDDIKFHYFILNSAFL